MTNGSGGGSGDGGGVIQVKNWHALLTLIGWLVMCSLMYGSLRAETDENTRRIQNLEAQPNVTLSQYQDGQRNLERRLERIETKLDAQDAQRRH